MATERQETHDHNAVAQALVGDAALTRLLLAHGTDLLCLLDLDGRFVYASPSYERVLGHAPAALIGTSAVALQHPADSGWRGVRWPSLAVGDHMTAVCRHRHADGSWRWLDMQATVALWQDARHVLGVARDISAPQAAVPLAQADESALTLLDTLFMGAPIGLGIVDRELRYVRINAALAAINGISAEAHLGHSVAELLPQIPASVTQDLAQVLAHGAPLLDREVQGETPATPGALRTWRASYYPMVTPDARLVGVGVLVSEISAQKWAEAEQHKFATLVHNSADLITIADLAGRVQFLNAAGQRLIEAGADDAAQPPALSAYLAPDAQSFMGELLPLVLREGRWEGELLLRGQRSHAHIPVKATLFVLIDQASGQPTGFAAVMRDIRDQKRVEQRLRLLAAASAALGSALYYEQTFTAMAKLIAESMAGWCVIALSTGDQAPHFHTSEHCDPARQQAFQQNIREQARAGGIFTQLTHGDQAMRLDAPAAHAAGSPLDTTTLMIAPMLLQQQRLGVLAIGRCGGAAFDDDDLQLATELANRAALAIEHARLYREAQTAIGVRDHFLSIASHELKTPLTSVLGNLQLLQRRLAQQERVTDRDQRALRVVTEQAQRMNQLISTLLDISRIQTGQLSIERTPLDIVALARRVVEEIQPTFDQHTIYFQSAIESAMVAGDAIRLEQVLHNLLQNAVKYSPGGGSVELLLRAADAQVELAVRDHGIGIPVEALPHLFERFYRAANVQAQHLSGIGIGLFVVREIVTMHGGEVRATSENAGSTFTVRLPLQQRGTVPEAHAGAGRQSVDQVA